MNADRGLKKPIQNLAENFTRGQRHILPHKTPLLKEDHGKK